MKAKTKLQDFSLWQTAQAVWYLLGDQKLKISFFAVLLSLILLYNLVPPFIVGRIVDFFANYKSGQSLTLFYEYCLFLGLATACVAFFRLAIKNALAKAASEVIYQTKVKGFDKLLQNSIRWHDKENTGNKVQKIQAGTDALTQMQDIVGNDAVIQTTSIFGVLLAFGLLHRIYFLFALCYLGVFYLVARSFYTRVATMQHALNKSTEAASGSYFEGLSNLLTLKTLGSRKDFRKTIASKETATRDLTKQIAQFGTTRWQWFQIINAIALTLFLLLLGRDFLARQVTLGFLFVFYSYFATLLSAVAKSADLIESLVSYKVGLARMMPIYWSGESEIEGDQRFPNAWRNLSVQNGTFFYPKNAGRRKNVGLDNISLTIKNGEKLGIVGKTGSGKSTLAKIIVGLHTLTSGSYQVDDKDFYQIGTDDVTNAIALVLQDPEMFNLSLKENITLLRKYDDALFRQALAIAQLESVVQKLPKGIETFIGEKGYRLSSGERQRIGIARAIYKDPKILILDEAFSSLDTKTESAIHSALTKYYKNRTIISITHRLATLVDADKIIVLDGGKIVEQGAFQKLKATKNSIFKSYLT